MTAIPPELIERERQLLAQALRAPVGAPPRRRKLKLRKISDHVTRTWVSAGCFGEAMQWRLKEGKHKET